MAKIHYFPHDNIKRCRYPVRQPTPFGKLLYFHIGRHEWSVSEFAAKTGLSTGFISGIFTGRKPPPLARVETWASILKLRGTARKRFIHLAHYMHASPELQRVIREMDKVICDNFPDDEHAYLDLEELTKLLK